MKNIARLTFCLLLLAASSFAMDKKIYQTGTLTEMNSVNCGYDQKDGKGIVGSLIGTDSGHVQEREALCQEYTLKADGVIYKFRPRDAKHPALLPIGAQAEFRIKKDKLVLRVPSGDGHEREYTVTAMQSAPATVAAK